MFSKTLFCSLSLPLLLSHRTSHTDDDCTMSPSAAKLHCHFDFRFITVIQLFAFQSPVPPGTDLSGPVQAILPQFTDYSRDTYRQVEWHGLKRTDRENYITTKNGFVSVPLLLSLSACGRSSYPPRALCSEGWLSRQRVINNNMLPIRIGLSSTFVLIDRDFAETPDMVEGGGGGAGGSIRFVGHASTRVNQGYSHNNWS